MAQPKIPLPTEGASGPPNATATCFCGAVQIKFPVDEVTTVHVCHCTDCHKIHSSMFGSNFVIKENVTTHTRGKELLTKYSRNDTTTTGNTMENHFCSVCGTLMYRVGTGFPGVFIARIATVDDFNLHDKLMKPEVEQFTKDRVQWLHGIEGVELDEGYHFK